MKIYITLIAIILSILLSSCEKELVYPDNGVYNPGNTNDLTLDGTTWVLTQYKKGFSPTVYPNDTIEFINGYYLINGNNYDTKYTLTQTGSLGTQYNLTLYEFPSFGEGGQWTTTLPNRFIAYGEINSNEFRNLSGGSDKVYATFKKLNNEN